MLFNFFLVRSLLKIWKTLYLLVQLFVDHSKFFMIYDIYSWSLCNYWVSFVVSSLLFSSVWSTHQLDLHIDYEVLLYYDNKLNMFSFLLHSNLCFLEISWIANWAEFSSRKSVLNDASRCSVDYRRYSINIYFVDSANVACGGSDGDVKSFYEHLPTEHRILFGWFCFALFSIKYRNQQ